MLYTSYKYFIEILHKFEYILHSLIYILYALSILFI